MILDLVRNQIRYSGWASRKVLDAARALPPEDLTRSVGISHGSILNTLAHIHFADRIWYSRVIDPAEEVIKESDWPTLETRWPEIQTKWEAWADSLDEAGLARAVPYKGGGDRTYENAVWQVVMHVVNHATLHRGQVVGMIRQLGLKPPGTDLIFYLRSLTTP
jgi:uncharacterized damage-inducible protein DinB